jgi:hypothetical protein
MWSSGAFFCGCSVAARERVLKAVAWKPDRNFGCGGSPGKIKSTIHLLTADALPAAAAGFTSQRDARRASSEV